MSISLLLQNLKSFGFFVTFGAGEIGSPICLIGCTKSDEEPSFGMQKLTFNTKIGNQMQNLGCRNVLNVKFPKIVAEKLAFYKISCKSSIL